MSLRASILQHSLPLLPKHSFTRHTLAAALQAARLNHAATPSALQNGSPRTAKDDDPDAASSLDATGRENTIDTLFGSGSIAPGRALLEAWQEAGLQVVEDAEYRQGDVESRLERRLEFSAGVGEHLVEAYALMSSPSSAPSIPLPSLPRSVLDQLSSFSVPPLYQPPTDQRPVADEPRLRLNEPLASDPPLASTLLGRLESATGGRLPLLRFNPIGPLSYAWNIADRALAVDERRQGVKMGLMEEPTGSGPEWYTTRIALGLAYLAAESHLLQPFEYPVTKANPHLEIAKTSLRSHLKQYDGLRDSVPSSQAGTEDVKSMLEFFERGAVGLLRSRGL